MKLCLAILFLGIVTFSYAQQVPLSSQYMMNRLIINPAYAGELGFYSASLSYRKQWVGLEGAPSTQNVSIHGPVLKGKLGLGLMVFRDVIGVSRENNISGSFSYKIKMKRKKTISFGVSASAVFANNEWSQIVSSDPNDVAFSTNSPQYIFPDFSAGAYYHTKNYFVGFSMPMFLQHQLEGESSGFSIKNDFKQYNYLAEIGGNIKLDKTVVKPSILTRYLPSSSFQMDINCIVDIENTFGIGLSYRTNDAIVGLVQIHVTDQFIFGYSYDHSISKLQGYNNGSHEIFLRYDFKYRVKAFDPRFF